MCELPTNMEIVDGPWLRDDVVLGKTAQKIRFGGRREVRQKCMAGDVKCARNIWREMRSWFKVDVFSEKSVVNQEED